MRGPVERREEDSERGKAISKTQYCRLPLTVRLSVTLMITLDTTAMPQAVRDEEKGLRRRCG
jgi:hypothetical protein